jgi:cell division protein FtsL
MTPPASAAAAQPAPRVAPPRPRRAPAHPRRVSGPARPAHRRVPAEPSREGLLAGALGLAGTLSSHRLLDRLIRGRLWIGIVAFALIGIVTLQLGLLKLNSGIGRALVRASVLQRENATLSIENSELSSGSRVEALAEQLGMRLSGISTLHFRSSQPAGDVARAAEVLRKPLVPASEAPGTEASASGSSETAEVASGGETSTTGEAAKTGEATNSGETAAAGEAASQQSPSQSSGGEAVTREAAEQASPSPGAAGAAAAPGASPASSTPASAETGGAVAGPGG